jgi:hypothetical protein
MRQRDTLMTQDFSFQDQSLVNLLEYLQNIPRLKILGFLHRVVPVQVRPGAPLPTISSTYLGKSSLIRRPSILLNRQTKSKVSNSVIQRRHTLSRSRFHSTARITFLKSPVSTSPEFGGKMARFINGWVKIHRRAMLGDINSSFVRGGLFGALVAMANIQNSTISWKGKPRNLERGEILTSFQELAELGNVDRKTVSKHLNYLAIRGTVSIEKSNFGIIVKLLKFHTHQGVNAAWSHQGPSEMDDGMDNAMDDGVPHIEEVKNLRKKEKKNIYVCAFDFEESFKKYPVQIKGPNAEKRWAEQMTSREVHDDFLKALGNYLLFLAHPDNSYRQPKQSFATFLGTERSGYFWRDWINFDLSTLPKKELSGPEQWAAEQRAKGQAS